MALRNGKVQDKKLNNLLKYTFEVCIKTFWRKWEGETRDLKNAKINTILTI